MDIKYDFSKLWALVDKLGATRDPMTASSVNLLPTSKSETQSKAYLSDLAGIEIGDLSGQININKQGLLEVDGQPVIAYIYDHTFNFHQVIAGEKEGNKFHLCNCQTLQMMRKRRPLQRYIATNITHNIFPIGAIIENQALTGQARLLVCTNCLNDLNYQEASTNANAREIQMHFDIATFFNTIKLSTGLE